MKVPKVLDLFFEVSKVYFMSTATAPDEVLPAGFKINGDPLEAETSIWYEPSAVGAGVTARFSCVGKNGREGLAAGCGSETGATQQEARQKVIQALAAIRYQ